MEAVSDSRGEPLRLVATPGALPLGAIFLAIGVLGGGLVVLLGLDRLPLTLCSFKLISGLPCMSCGTTRALAALAHLDLAQAFAMNPLASVGAALLLPWGLTDLALLARRRALRLELPRELLPAVRWGALALVLANWAYLIAVGR